MTFEEHKAWVANGRKVWEVLRCGSPTTRIVVFTEGGHYPLQWQYASDFERLYKRAPAFDKSVDPPGTSDRVIERGQGINYFTMDRKEVEKLIDQRLASVFKGAGILRVKKSKEGRKQKTYRDADDDTWCRD